MAAVLSPQARAGLCQAGRGSGRQDGIVGPNLALVVSKDLNRRLPLPFKTAPLSTHSELIHT